MTSMPLDYWSKPEARRRDPSLELPSISDDRPRQTGEREGGLSNLLGMPGAPREYIESMMAQQNETQDLYSSYGKDPWEERVGRGGRGYTSEFMDYAKSKGYGITDMTSMDAGMQLTKKEWDVEKEKFRPEWGSFLHSLFDPKSPDGKPRDPGHTPRPSMMPRPGVFAEPELTPTGPNLVPRPDPSLNPFQPSVPEVQPPSPSVSPRPEPKPGIHFPQLPTGQKVSNFLDPENPGLNPPSIRLKHGGSLTDKVSRILRNLL